jgi:uncharacterized damage-inducible protein DinB
MPASARWAGKIDDAWLDGDVVWFSLAANREVRARNRLLVGHFFDHRRGNLAAAGCLAVDESPRTVAGRPGSKAR